MGLRGHCLVLWLAAVFTAGTPACGETRDSMAAVAELRDFEVSEAKPAARMDRSNEPYAPLGLRAGVFDFRPSLEIAAVISDNPGQLSADARSAAGGRLTPELELKSDWVRHGFHLKASGERSDYVDQPELATMEGQI